MRKKKIPMRKCIISNEMRPKKDMIRVVINKEGEIFADATGKKQGRGAYVSKDVALVEKAQQREVLEKYFTKSFFSLRKIRGKSQDIFLRFSHKFSFLL